MITGTLSWAFIKRPGGKGRKDLEKNVSAKQRLKKEDTRFQGAHEYQGGAPGTQEKAGQRKKAPDGLTGRRNLQFPRAVKIRSRSDYLRIQNTGKKERGRYLVLLTAHNDLPVSRFGITVSKRNRNAVRRNRIKRKIREVQRLNREHILPGNDIIVIARQMASMATFNQLETEYLSLARKAGLIERD